MSAMGVSTCDDHDDCIVIYTGRKCPVCSLVEDHKSEHDIDVRTVGELEDKVAELTKEQA